MSDVLGSIVKQECIYNTDGCEVQISTLKELGLHLKSREFIDWLNRYGLRMLKPTHRSVCFVLAPKLPEDLKVACEKWKSEKRDI